MRPKRDSRQLALGEGPDDALARLRDTAAAAVLREQVAELGSRLVLEHGLQPSSAQSEGRYLVAAVKESQYQTLEAFLEDDDEMLASIRRPARRQTRLARLRVVRDAIVLVQDDPARAEGLERRLPGRTGHIGKFADVEVGGAVYEERERRFPTWLEADALIEGARASGVRDAALIALHLRSTLPPGALLMLTWEAVRSLGPAAGGVHVLAFEWNGAWRRYVVHETAASALSALGRAEGNPESGAVFRTLPRPRVPLSAAMCTHILRAVCDGAGLPRYDRRHLHVPFAWWLRQQGWRDLALRDALGVGTVRDVRRMLLPFEEFSAQNKASEWLSVRSLEGAANDDGTQVGSRGGDQAIASPVNPRPDLTGARPPSIVPIRFSDAGRFNGAQAVSDTSPEASENGP